MGLFTKSNSSTAVLPKLEGLSEEAKRLAQRGGDTSMIAPPPPALAAALAAASARPASIPTAPTERQLYLQQLKVRIHHQLVERLNVQNLRTLPPQAVRP